MVVDVLESTVIVGLPGAATEKEDIYTSIRQTRIVLTPILGLTQ